MTKLFRSTSTAQKSRHFGAISVLALAISACAPVEVKQTQGPELPSAWTEQDYVASVTIASPNAEVQLNHGFSDPALAALINEGISNNLTLRQAQLRIQSAEQGLRTVRALNGAQVSVGTGASRVNTSEPAYPVGSSATYNNLQLAGNVSYTLDIWGTKAAQEDAQAANIRAAAANAQSAQLTLTTAIARAFYATKYSQAQLSALRALKEVEVDTLAATRDQVNLGYDTTDALTEANLDNIAIDNQLIIARANYAANQRALAYLLGRSPSDYVKGVELGETALDKLDIPWAFPGLPSELIARRPDIKLAQADMDAAFAQASVSNRAHLPNFALTSQLGLQSAALGDFISAPAIFWNLAADASAVVFDNGNIEAQQAAGQLGYESTEVAYRQQVYTAFKETQDALASYDSQKQQWRNQVKLLNNQNRLYQQEQSRLELGETAPIVALAVKKAWISAQLAYLTSRYELLNASVDLYQALGGPIPDQG